MKIEGSELIRVEPGVLFPLLRDANLLRRVLPGSEELSATGGEEYRVHVRQRLGPYDDLFTGTLHLSEKDTEGCLRVIANLECPNGLIRIAGDIQLEETADKSTLLRYEGEANLGGRLTSVPPRLLETTANAYLRRIFEALEREIAGPQPYPLRRPDGAPGKDTTGQHMSLALPSWVVPLLAATAGLVFLRVVDNRRINRLLQANAAQTTSRTETP
jgi:carbon monoxide dehydrogenase subunit G